MTRAVRAAGAEPVTTAVVRGAPTLGLDGDALERFLAPGGVHKVSARDLPAAVAFRRDGATTVAAALALATAAGIGVFATGGIGGVHRGDGHDESADLIELSRSPIAVVCAGAKSILDLPATLERLETLSVTVVGYRTDDFPGFFTRATGLAVPQRVDNLTQLVAVVRAARSLARPGAVLIVQPVPADHALDEQLVDDVVAHAIAESASAGIRGSQLTPYLLAAVQRATEGRSLAANLALLESNASLAGALAAALGGS
jgi:pseudouridine-5'-phosphate glycosidase